MALIISPPSPVYFAPAVFLQLSEAGGLQQHKFDVQCRRHTAEQLAALDAEIQAIPQSAARDQRVFEKAIAGWRGVQDAGGAEIPFSFDAAAATEDQFPGFIAACVRAFYLSLQPVESAHFVQKR